MDSKKMNSDFLEKVQKWNESSKEASDQLEDLLTQRQEIINGVIALFEEHGFHIRSYKDPWAHRPYGPDSINPMAQLTFRVIPASLKPPETVEQCSS